MAKADSSSRYSACQKLVFSPRRCSASGCRRNYSVPLMVGVVAICFYGGVHIGRILSSSSVVELSGRTLSNAANRRITNDTATDESAMAHQSEDFVKTLCTEMPLPKPLAEYGPGTVNKLRRELALQNRSCYERYFSAFATYTHSRLEIVKKHISLHIPKAGGTSLCQLAKSWNKTTPTRDCWAPRHWKPMWAFGQFGDRREVRVGCNNRSNCDEFVDSKREEFIMNENYLDHPLLLDVRLYSMVLREPIDRALSHERHLESFRKHSQDNVTYLARVALAQSNYMTWAMAAGAEPFGKRVSLSPRRRHLDIAKDMLAQFDFLLALSEHNQTCDRATLGAMGLGGQEIGRARKKRGKKPGQILDRRLYASWNALDMELYNYARKLLEVDCDFFLRLERDEDLSRRERYARQ